MDHNSCRVVYIDDRFPWEKWISKSSSPIGQDSAHLTVSTTLPPELQANVDAILQVFSQVYICKTGRSFSTKLAELNEAVKIDCIPIIALFDIAPDVRHEITLPRGRKTFLPDDEPPSPGMPGMLRRELTFTSESDESYGLQLLSRIASDLQVQENGKLIIPIAITRPKDSVQFSPLSPVDEKSPLEPNPKPFRKSSASTVASEGRRTSSAESQMMLKCLDAGAIDVVLDQLDQGRAMSFSVHAYRAYKAAKKSQSSFLSTKKSRRQSWVGIDEHRPYAYLREAMVKKLMSRICDPEDVLDDYQSPELSIEETRKSEIADEVGKWSFCAHDFDEEELVYAACCMLNHAVQIEELERWRISFDNLVMFVQAARAAYNSFVIYHNFRHAIDVLQSVFYFLVRIRALPPYPLSQIAEKSPIERTPVANLVQPFEALTLLISAIGHDVGHPGVNNMFLIKLNAPLAQLYNDQSVLEAFHCAAYSQILRRHWPAAFEDKSLRKLLISSILATDMGIHSDYMQQLGNLQSRIHESKTTDGWSPKELEMYRILTCGLLIKCADISNVARPWHVAERWTHLLQEEFAHQGEMEVQVGMESCLFGGPPEIGNMLKLANGQLGFMSLFGSPLFEGVADVMPAMHFAAEEIITNKGVWFTRAEQEKRRDLFRLGTNGLGGSMAEGLISPRSQSPMTITQKSDRRHPSESTTSPEGYFPPSSLGKYAGDTPMLRYPSGSSAQSPTASPKDLSQRSSNGDDGIASTIAASGGTSGAFPNAAATLQAPPPLQARRSSNTISNSQLHLSNMNGGSNGTEHSTPSTSKNGGSSENDPPRGTTSTLNTSDMPNVKSAAAASGTKQEALRSVDVTLPSHKREFQRSSVAADFAQPKKHQQQGSLGLDRGSKHTLSTVMTPASPSTQATSFLSESSEDRNKSLVPTESAASEDRSLQSNEMNGVGGTDSTNSRRSQSADLLESTTNREAKKSFRTTILQSPQGQLLPPNGNSGGLPKSTMPRKRSRLRLAFWRKAKSSDESGDGEGIAVGADGRYS